MLCAVGFFVNRDQFFRAWLIGYMLWLGIALGSMGLSSMLPAGPILDYGQVFADPHVRHREMAVEVEHPRAGRSRVLGIPVKLSSTPGSIRRPAPTLGQHTDEVLKELGYDAAAVANLKARNIV